MSANRFTIACCTFGSVVVLLPAGPASWSAERPHDQNTVPAPNTSAPLVGSRYSPRLWCPGPGTSTFPNWVLTVGTCRVVEERLTRPAGMKPLSGDESHS